VAFSIRNDAPRPPRPAMRLFDDRSGRERGGVSPAVTAVETLRPGGGGRQDIRSRGRRPRPMGPPSIPGSIAYRELKIGRTRPPGDRAQVGFRQMRSRQPGLRQRRADQGRGVNRPRNSSWLGAALTPELWPQGRRAFPHRQRQLFRTPTIPPRRNSGRLRRPGALRRMQGPLVWINHGANEK